MRRPLIAILGSTGTGKTKLSVEICKKFNGEVISTDSMQIYRALNIATAKVSEEEACGVVHHMVNIVSPDDLGFSVVHFRDQVLQILDDIWTRAKLPVLVGGTNYYIEAILYNTLLPTLGTLYDSNSKDSKYSHTIYSQSTEQLYERLKQVDTVSASEIHPLRRRQIERALQIYDQHGKPRSELYTQQWNQQGASVVGGPLRFTDSCLLWLRTSKEILDVRLNKRVDCMVNEGLEREITDFYDTYFESHQAKILELFPALKTNQDLLEANELKGLFQSIAVKEFMPLLKLNCEQRQTEEGRKLWEEGVERLKQRTRRYARKQDQWVRNRLIRLAGRQIPPLFELDCGSVQNWDSLVSQPATEIIRSYLDGTPFTRPTVDPTQYEGALLGTRCDRNKVYRCPQCNVFSEGIAQWNVHVTSKRHKKRLTSLNKLQKNIEQRITQLRSYENDANQRENESETLLDA